MSFQQKAKLTLIVFLTAFIAFLAPIPIVFAQSITKGTVKLEDLQKSFKAGE